MKKKITHTKFDLRAFEECFQEHFTPLTFFAKKFVIDLDSSKEIVHDVFVRLWEKRETIDPNNSVKSYLYTSVHNRCLNYIRDQKKINSNIEHLEDFHADSNWEESDSLQELELEEKINATIQTLPDRCKEVFLLNRFEGLKYKEVAEKLGISVKTVEIQMSKALKILRKHLSDYINVLILILMSFFE